MKQKQLNIGAGADIRSNFINLDIRDLPGIDVVCDITNGLPFEDGEIDFVLAQDILEHFPLDYTDTLMQELNRVLKVKGNLKVQVPNTMLNFQQYQNNTQEKPFKQNNAHRLSACIFGGQDYPGNFHYQLFDKERLAVVFERNGFDVIKEWENGRCLSILGKKT